MRKISSVSVRLATLKDLETLVSQRREMHEEMRHRTKLEHRSGDAAYRKFIREMTRRKRFVGFLAIDKASKNKAVAGGCIWLRDSQPRPQLKQTLLVPYLLSVYTKPTYRKKGVATAIVKEAMNWSKKHGFRMMTLHASKAGRAVYEKLGWEETSEMRVRLIP